MTETAKDTVMLVAASVLSVVGLVGLGVLVTVCAPPRAFWIEA